MNMDFYDCSTKENTYAFPVYMTRILHLHSPIHFKFYFKYSTFSAKLFCTAFGKDLHKAYYLKIKIFCISVLL